MDDVGAEILEGADDQRHMPDITGIKGKVFFEREGNGTAGQLKCGELILHQQAWMAIAGADEKKGEAAAPNERFKLAAGVGDAVDFVERVGEVSDSRSGAHEIR